MSRPVMRLYGLDQFSKDLKNVSSNVMEKEFKRRMWNATGIVRDEARRKAPVGVSSPGLRNGIINKVKSWKSGEVGVLQNIKHAKWIESGTKPHFPPPKALEKWARLKLGSSNPKQTAYLIARKISKVGTKAQPFLFPALEDMTKQVENEFNMGIKEIFNYLKK